MKKILSLFFILFTVCCAIAQQVSVTPLNLLLAQLVVYSNVYGGAAGTGANFNDTNFAPAANGVYRVSCYSVIIQAASVSSTLPACEFTYVDEYETSVQPLTIAITATSGANTVGTVLQGSVIVTASQVNNSTTLFSTGYASSGGTPMLYSTSVRVEFLGIS